MTPPKTTEHKDPVYIGLDGLKVDVPNPDVTKTLKITPKNVYYANAEAGQKIDAYSAATVELAIIKHDQAVVQVNKTYDNAINNANSDSDKKWYEDERHSSLRGESMFYSNYVNTFRHAPLTRASGSNTIRPVIIEPEMAVNQRTYDAILEETLKGSYPSFKENYNKTPEVLNITKFQNNYTQVQMAYNAAHPLAGTQAKPATAINLAENAAANAQLTPQVPQITVGSSGKQALLQSNPSMFIDGKSGAVITSHPLAVQPAVQQQPSQTAAPAKLPSGSFEFSASAFRLPAKPKDTTPVPGK